MVNGRGHCWMPLSLQGHFGHLSLDVSCRLLIIQVTWLGSHWHGNNGCKLKLWISSFSFGTKASVRKLRNDWACTSHILSMLSWRSIKLPPTDSFAGVKVLQTWEQILASLIKPPDWQFKEMVVNHYSLGLPNQTSGIMQLLRPTQGCQKCDSGMQGEFSGLTKVKIYPVCATPLQRAVVLASPVPDPIDAGWQATCLTHKQTKAH